MADKLDASGTLRAQAALLGQKFLARTTQEVSTMRDLIEDSTPEDATVLPQLERMAHKIHGSGATFGFPKLSECAGAVEQLVADWLSHDIKLVPPPGSPERARLTECMGSLVLAVKEIAVKPRSDG